MGLFAEVFDTTRNQASDFAAAETVLMLGALRPEPCTLASVHAINSTLLLNRCCSPQFYNLVIKGRIQFRCRRDKDGNRESPRQQLIQRMGDERYFYAWPETRDEYEPGRFRNKPEVCEAVRRMLAGDSYKTGIPDLDARVARALELFSAIDQNHYADGGQASEDCYEKPREWFFRTALEAVKRDVPENEEHRELSELIEKLGADPGVSGRSAAYDAIDKYTNDDKLVDAAKDIVDGVYNSSVAHSLGARFLSSSRKIRLGSRFHLTTQPREASIHYAEQPNDTSEVPKNCGISWQLIHEAIPLTEKINKYESKDAAEKLAKVLAKDHVARFAQPIAKGTLAMGASSVAAAASGVAVLTFGGAVASWSAPALLLISAITGVATGVSQFVEQRVTKRNEGDLARRIEQQLNGWLDQ